MFRLKNESSDDDIRNLIQELETEEIQQLSHYQWTAVSSLLLVHTIVDLGEHSWSKVKDALTAKLTNFFHCYSQNNLHFPPSPDFFTAQECKKQYQELMDRYPRPARGFCDEDSFRKKVHRIGIESNADSAAAFLAVQLYDQASKDNQTAMTEDEEQWLTCKEEIRKILNPNTSLDELERMAEGFVSDDVTMEDDVINSDAFSSIDVQDTSTPVKLPAVCDASVDPTHRGLSPVKLFLSSSNNSSEETEEPDLAKISYSDSDEADSNAHPNRWDSGVELSESLNRADVSELSVQRKLVDYSISSSSESDVEKLLDTERIPAERDMEDCSLSDLSGSPVFLMVGVQGYVAKDKRVGDLEDDWLKCTGGPNSVLAASVMQDSKNGGDASGKAKFESKEAERKLSQVGILESEQRNDLKKLLRAALEKVSEHMFACYFMDLCACEDYCKIVKKPMDLRILKQAVEDGVVKSEEDFLRNLNLMFMNVIMLPEKNWGNSTQKMHSFSQQMQVDIIPAMRVRHPKSIEQIRTASDTENL